VQRLLQQQQQQQQWLQQLCHLSLCRLLLQPQPQLNPYQLRLSLEAATALGYALPHYMLQPAFQLLLQSASRCYSYVPSDVGYTALLLARSGYTLGCDQQLQQQQLLELFYEQLSVCNSNSITTSETAALGGAGRGHAGRVGGPGLVTPRALCMQGEVLMRWGFRPGAVWVAAYSEAAAVLLPEMTDEERGCVTAVIAWLRQQQPIRPVQAAAVGGSGAAAGGGSGVPGIIADGGCDMLGGFGPKPPAAAAAAAVTSSGRGR
jgi:hypothetical protein